VTLDEVQNEPRKVTFLIPGGPREALNALEPYPPGFAFLYALSAVDGEMGCEGIDGLHRYSGRIDPSCLTIALLFLLCLPCGCTTVARSPDIPRPISLPALAGKVDYAGPPTYLPRSIASDDHGPAVFRYRYDVKQSDDDYPVLLLMFNPLILFGFPTGTSKVAVVGDLDIVRGGESTRYEASCTVEYRRSVYSSRNLSALRARALLEVRDVIDAQLERDAARMGHLLSPSKGAQSR
jgi:hypothetical protein